MHQPQQQRQEHVKEKLPSITICTPSSQSINQSNE